MELEKRVERLEKQVFGTRIDDVRKIFDATFCNIGGIRNFCINVAVADEDWDVGINFCEWLYQHEMLAAADFVEKLIDANLITEDSVLHAYDGNIWLVFNVRK